MLIKLLTVRQGADGDVLSGDARPVLIVGHHTETVLRVLLQSSHGVGLTANVQVLKDRNGQTEKNVICKYVGQQSSTRGARQIFLHIHFSRQICIYFQ